MHTTAGTAIGKVAVRFEDHGVYDWLWRHAPCTWHGKVETKFTSIPFRRIERAGSYTNPARVSQWLGRMRTGRAVPPLIVCRTEHDYFYVHDGNHRCAAMYELFGGDESSIIRVALMVPKAGFQFRYRSFTTYGTYILEAAPGAQASLGVVPADAHSLFAGRTLVLVPHPTGETACAGLLQRLRDALVVFATDGAPADPSFWRAYGSRQNYAAVRRVEAMGGTSLAGAAGFEFLPDYVTHSQLADQQLYRALPQAFAALRKLIRRYQPEQVLVPAYEGGHPDHDACSALGALVRKHLGIAVWEMPFYHRSPGGALIFQRFQQRNGSEVMLVLSPHERHNRAVAAASYRSQHDLPRFLTAPAEHYRLQPEYDYSLPPHSGMLNYQAWEWPISPLEVCRYLSAGATGISGRATLAATSLTSNSLTSSSLTSTSLTSNSIQPLTLDLQPSLAAEAL